MLSENFDRFIQNIDNAEKIALLPHIYADGDALGNAVTTSYQIVESAHKQLTVGSAKLEAHLTVLCVSVIDHCHDMQWSVTILLRPSPAA